MEVNIEAEDAEGVWKKGWGNRENYVNPAQVKVVDMQAEEAPKPGILLAGTKVLTLVNNLEMKRLMKMLKLKPKKCKKGGKNQNTFWEA